MRYETERGGRRGGGERGVCVCVCSEGNICAEAASGGPLHLVIEESCSIMKQ